MSTTTESKISRTWHARIDSGVMRHSHIRQWAQAVYRLGLGLEPGGFRTNLSEGEAADLCNRLNAWHPDEAVRLEPEHTEAGLTWLRRFAVELPDQSGEVGSFPVARLDPDTGDFDHFEFRGEAVTYGYRGASPVWVIVFANGDEITYWSAPWQAKHYSTGASPAKGWRFYPA